MASPSFQIGIESEVLLTLRQETKKVVDLEELADSFAKNYNKLADAQFHEYGY